MSQRGGGTGFTHKAFARPGASAGDADVNDLQRNLAL
jgi:hypothetical protein